MRLIMIAACGAILAACTQTGDTVNEAAPANDIEGTSEAATHDSASPAMPQFRL